MIIWIESKSTKISAKYPARESAKGIEMTSKELDKLFEILKKKDDPFIFLIKDDKKMAVMNHGSTSDLMHLLQTEYREMKKMLEKKYGEIVAKHLLKGITMTDEEMEDEMEKGFPSLDKLFDDFEDEEEDDDADDESEDDHVATPEEIAEFIKSLSQEDLKKYETVGKAIEDLQNALSTVGLSFSGNLRIDHADGSDDRG